MAKIIDSLLELVMMMHIVDEILDYLVDENIKRVKLYFSPKETELYIKTPLEGEDTLFALGKDTILLKDNQFMFPELSYT